MAHECDDCDQTFETLTRLRRHDCSSSATTTTTGIEGTADGGDGEYSQLSWEERRPDAIEVEELEDVLGSTNRALAIYERELKAADDADASTRYSGIRRAYRRRLIEEVDEATQANEWSVLEDLIEAYHPNSTDGFPHVTTILQNVVGRQFIRTRIFDGVEAIPVVALEYFETIRIEVDEDQDTVLEGLHPYGWTIGHPEFDVADRIHDHASKEIFSTNPMLEHAFYADQHEAVELFERIVSDDSIQYDLQLYVDDKISGTRYLLDAIAGAVSDDHWPTVPRHWDWYEDDELPFDFELDAGVERQIRDIVSEEGLDADLPSDWELTAFTL